MKKPGVGTEPEAASGGGRPPCAAAENAPPADAARSDIAQSVEINSEALLAGRTEVRIRHRGEIYRLTLTRAGKLILHK